MVDVPSPGLPLRDNPVALLAAAAWAGLLCYPASLLPGVAGGAARGHGPGPGPRHGGSQARATFRVPPADSR